MFSSRRFTCVLGFSLLTWLVISVNKANAQTIELTSLDADCTNAESAGSTCNPVEKSQVLQGGGTVEVSLADLLGGLQQVNQQDFFQEMEVDFGSNVGDLSPSAEDYQRAALNFGISDRFTISSSADQFLGHSTPSLFPSEKPTEQVLISNLSTLQKGKRLFSDSSPVRASKERQRNLIAFSKPSPDDLTFSQLDPSPEVTVPEPSISPIAWLGLAALGLFSTRFRAKK